MTNDKLSELFGVPPIKSDKVDIITKQGEVIPVDPQKSAEDKQIDKDFEKIRNNISEIMSQGNSALWHAIEVAKSSEHPRAFEVVANMMKQLTDINVQLLDAHKKHKELVDKQPEEKPVTGGVTNNSIFVGSTLELAKMLEDMKKGK